ELGMTQDLLAEKMNVTAQAVSKWERDLSYPDVDTIKRLAFLFGCSIDTLVNGTSPTLQKDEPESVDKRIVRVFTKADDTTIHVRIPVACFEEIFKFTGIFEDIDDLPGLLPIVEMIKSGVMGEIVNLEQDGRTVVISVENYES
ncbi:MAG: helix-turn-helix transcriptional regulator, partial [Clostridia bacterium]|nr:helix-turn-helix transcriptional regulator [Clostridia bacterium]